MLSTSTHPFPSQLCLFLTTTKQKCFTSLIPLATVRIETNYKPSGCSCAEVKRKITIHWPGAEPQVVKDIPWNTPIAMSETQSSSDVFWAQRMHSTPNSRGAEVKPDWVQTCSYLFSGDVKTELENLPKFNWFIHNIQAEVHGLGILIWQIEIFSLHLLFRDFCFATQTPFPWGGVFAGSIFSGLLSEKCWIEL